MKQASLLILAMMLLPGCNREEGKAVNKIQGPEVPSGRVEPDTTSYPSETELVDEATVLKYIVVVREGYNYDSLKNVAFRTAELLNLKFDSLGRHYDPQRGIILPDDYEDDLYAGQYFLRRTEEDIVSVEMRHAYVDTELANGPGRERMRQDTSRMFVFAAMYTEREKADSVVKIIKPIFSNTKVIAADIYMGCMH